MQRPKKCGGLKTSFLMCFFELFLSRESAARSREPKPKSFAVLCWNARYYASLRYWYVCVSFLLYNDYIMLMFLVYSFSHSLLNLKQARRAESVCILLRVF